MKSYDYEHRQGVEEITWPRFVELYRQIAEKLAAAEIQAVVGIARSGLLPATAVAAGLRCELHPVRVTRRVNDRVEYDHPVWRVGVPEAVRGRQVAVIDEIADTGETLEMVAAQVRAQGAAQVLTATLVSHTWADPFPDIVSLVTDALVIFPWDRQVYLDSEWQMHPELVEALNSQRSKKDQT